MKQISRILLAAVASASLCGTEVWAEESVDVATPEAPEITNETEMSLDDKLAIGGAVYARECAKCHGPAGGGGQGPAFVGNADLDDAEYIIDILLHGLGYMPPFGSKLDDEEISSVLTYIRSSWENDYKDISLAEVIEGRE